MDRLYILSILISILIGLIQGDCEGIDAGPIISYQRTICDYKAGDELFDIKEYGGEHTLLNDGTVECSLTDSTDILSCIAILKHVNVTDAYGNVSTKVVAGSQGCWRLQCIVDVDCPEADECVTPQARDPLSAVMCCCRGNRCNREENANLLPYVDDSTTVARGIDDRLRGTSTESIIILVVLIVVLLLLATVGIIIFYICRKRKQEDEKVLQRKMDQYNYDMRIYSDEPPLVNFDDMVMGTCIHRGRFGDVFKATLNDREVCVKYFHAQQRPLFYTEKEIYGVLDPHVKTVVQCLACDERSHPDGTIQYLVIMEYMPLGSLASYLKANTLSWRELCSMAQTAAAGIGYLHGETIENGLHKHAIVHRDINSRNILVRSDMTCAIADMGFSLKIRGSKVIRDGVEEHAEDGSLRDVGTVRYMAPEILECAVNLRDCESSLKQIDMYAFALVLWELVTRCTDILYETKRFMLPFEEKLGTHPTFETMRIHVAKENHRPLMPVTMRANEATNLLRETIDECWDADAEARLSAYCVEERFKEMDILMERKGVPTLSKNETSNYEVKKCNSSSSNDIINRDHIEMSPLLETPTPASESNCTTLTNLDTPDQNKPDVNIDMDRERLLAPTCGRNILTERNTMPVEDEEMMALHDNTLIPLQEARARQAAEEERSRRHWEETLANQSTESSSHGQRSRPLIRSVQLDILNEVREHDAPIRPAKENNLNVRRHNSQRNVYESSTSSNGGSGGSVLTIPDCNLVRTSRPRSLNLNIKPEST